MYIYIYICILYSMLIHPRTQNEGPIFSIYIVGPISILYTIYCMMVTSPT